MLVLLYPELQHTGSLKTNTQTHLYLSVVARNSRESFFYNFFRPIPKKMKRLIDGDLASLRRIRKMSTKDR
jgi:hypothetical protein